MTDKLPTSYTCKSCGNVFTGVYCNHCGEKVIVPKDRSMQVFVRNILIAVTFADNRFIKTLWLTIKNPGFLSKEYADGRRVHYLRPLQLFFVLNLIYFLFPVLQLFNSSLRTQMYYLFHSAMVRPMVIEHVVQEGLSLDGFALMYDAKTTGLAKLLMVIFVLLASLPLSLIFRKKNRYFTDHVALSVELACYNIFVNAILLSGILWLLNDTTFTVIFVSTNLYFIYRAAGTFYQQKGKRLVVKSLLAILGLFLALEAYRLMLFFVTFWSV
jgi:DNA-directed RNA polymerase subunit RPC12/RpoP